jgi:hypothetical protein
VGHPISWLGRAKDRENFEKSWQEEEIYYQWRAKDKNLLQENWFYQGKYYE